MSDLSPQEVDELCRTADPAPVLLDVREPWELSAARIRFARGHAVDIPMMSIPSRLAEVDRTRPVVCICHHGVRSAQVVAFLLHVGYPAVYNLAGGIDAWSTQLDPSVPRY